MFSVVKSDSPISGSRDGHMCGGYQGSAIFPSVLLRGPRGGDLSSTDSPPPAPIPGVLEAAHSRCFTERQPLPSSLPHPYFHELCLSPSNPAVEKEASGCILSGGLFTEHLPVTLG